MNAYHDRVPTRQERARAMHAVVRSLEGYPAQTASQLINNALRLPSCCRTVPKVLDILGELIRAGQVERIEQTAREIAHRRRPSFRLKEQPR